MELITAFVFGDEKRAKPAPRNIRTGMMKLRGLFSSRNTSRDKPMVTIVIPIEATILGSILSDNFPANGEIIAMTTGCAPTRAEPRHRDSPLRNEVNALHPEP